MNPKQLTAQSKYMLIRARDNVIRRPKYFDTYDDAYATMARELEDILGEPFNKNLQEIYGVYIYDNVASSGSFSSSSYTWRIFDSNY